LPVLLVRDLWVRWKLSLPGLFLLGLAYGIYNEGVLAKTLLRSTNVPINAFDHYTFLGINCPWAFLIVPWHALHAIVFPIAIITWLYPSARYVPWLSPREFTMGSAFLILFGCFIFVVSKSIVVSPLYLVFFWMVMAGLIAGAKRLSRKDSFLGEGGAPQWKQIMAGFALYPIMVIGLSLLAGCKFPGILICGASVLLLAYSYRLIVRRNWLSMASFMPLVLGDYLSGSIFTLLVLLGHGNLIGAVGNGILIVIFCRWIALVLRVCGVNSPNSTGT
jgi:hypothetical protein